MIESGWRENRAELPRRHARGKISTMAWWRKTLLGLCAAAALSSPALAGSKKDDASDGPPPPQPGTFEAVIANNPISAILQGPRLWTTPQEPKDWVKATRPKEEPDFMPVGVTPAKHPLQVRSPAELAAAKADLDKSQSDMQTVIAQKPVLAPLTPPPPVGPPPTIGHITADRPSSSQAKLDPPAVEPAQVEQPKIDKKKKADKGPLDKAKLKKLSKVKSKPADTAD
jgi:hypothetical protein